MSTSTTGLGPKGVNDLVWFQDCDLHDVNNGYMISALTKPTLTIEADVTST